MLIFQEEVDTEVRFRDDCGILDCKVADARKDEILECFDANNARSGVYQQDMRLFQCDLASSSPEA